MAVTQKQAETELLTVREALLAQPKVKLMIPPDRSNPSKHRTVIISGQEFVLAVGKQLEVPEEVARVWNESFTKTVEAEFSMEQFNEL